MQPIMYQQKLNKIQKAINQGKFEVNVSETAFIMKMNQTKSENFTDRDKIEINRMWCKI